MGHDLFPPSHSDMSDSYGSYPSALHLDNEDTTHTTDKHSDGSAFPFRDGRTAGSLAPPYAIQQYTASIQPRNTLGIERQVVASVLADPIWSGLLGHDPLSANHPDIPRSHSPEPVWPSSERSATPVSLFSRGSSASSGALSTHPPSLAHTHTTYSLAGTMPAHSMVPIGELEQLYSDEELIQSPCFLKDILQSPCDERLRTREKFHNHMLSHFGEFGPPTKALCIFCNRGFANEASSPSCWIEYLDHIRYQHFRNDMVLEQMRPDFVTWRYLFDIGTLTEARYKEICEMANERQPHKYPWLRPSNWESDEVKARRLAEEKRERELNMVVIKERPCRKRGEHRSSGQRSAKSSFT